MKIHLVHAHYDQNHLDNVIEKMQTLGAPTIRVIESPYGGYQALEGCHRLRAAHALGLVPEIEIIELTDDEIWEQIPEDYGFQDPIRWVDFFRKCNGECFIEFNEA